MSETPSDITPEAQAYVYYDENLNAFWRSSVPTTDEAAKVHVKRILGVEAAFIHAHRWDGTVESIK